MSDQLVRYGPSPYNNYTNSPLGSKMEILLNARHPPFKTYKVEQLEKSIFPPRGSRTGKSRSSGPSVFVALRPFESFKRSRFHRSILIP